MWILGVITGITLCVIVSALAAWWTTRGRDPQGLRGYLLLLILYGLWSTYLMLIIDLQRHQPPAAQPSPWQPVDQKLDFYHKTRIINRN